MFQDCFYAPTIFNGAVGGGGHIASPLSIRPVHTCTPCPIHTKNGLSFEYIGVLNSNFIHSI